jgi:hypothetical protein
MTLVLALLAVLVALAPSCRDSDYKVMAVAEGIQGFSFEYPSGYQLIRLDLRNDASYQYTQVGLSGDFGVNLAEVYVYLWYVDTLSSASMIMDQLLLGAAEMGDYELGNRSSLVIGDIIAEQAVFTADSALQDGTGATEVTSRPATYRVTCMVYGDLAVEIDMTCDMAVTDLTQEDYQHVLDTFTLS